MSSTPSMERRILYLQNEIELSKREMEAAKRAHKAEYREYDVLSLPPDAVSLTEVLDPYTTKQQEMMEEVRRLKIQVGWI